MVVVEVHGLPRVQQCLARRARGCGPPSQVAVHAPGQLVESLPPRPDQPRRPVVLARGQPHLARQQQLAAAQQPPAGEGPLGAQRLVAAVGEVDAPHPAGPEAEAGPAGTQQRR